MVDAHGEVGALGFEGVDDVDESWVEVCGFFEVAVGEDVADACVDEVGA